MELFPKLPPEKRRLMLTVAAVALVLVLLAAIGPGLVPFLRTGVTTPAETQQAIVGGLLETANLPEGEHELTFEARTRSGSQVTARTKFTLTAEGTPTPPPSPTPPVSGACEPPPGPKPFTHPNTRIIAGDREVLAVWETSAPTAQRVLCFRRPNETTWQQVTVEGPPSQEHVVGITVPEEVRSGSALVFRVANAVTSQDLLYPSREFLVVLKFSGFGECTTFPRLLHLPDGPWCLARADSNAELTTMVVGDRDRLIDSSRRYTCRFPGGAYVSKSVNCTAGGTF